jgi:hypothetical protein
MWEPKIDKEKSRKIRVQIRHVLMSKWDPIGVADEPCAADEYDMYIGDVFELLRGAATDAEIAKYLRWVETERMGLTDESGNALMPEATRAVAVTELQRLRSLF